MGSGSYSEIIDRLRLKGILPLFLTGMWETITERSSLSVSIIGHILSSTDTEMDQLSVFAEY